MSTDRHGASVTIRLNEVEAYDGSDDPASHAYRGMTERTAPMFDEPGTVYVYRSYGVHWCMNIVVGPAGQAAAVLLRGGEVVHGRDAVERRRGRSNDLANGPGRLCQALAVTGDDSGIPLGAGIDLKRRAKPPGSWIQSSPRVGISRATDRPWRFTLEQNPE